MTAHRVRDLKIFGYNLEQSLHCIYKEKKDLINRFFDAGCSSVLQVVLHLSCIMTVHFVKGVTDWPIMYLLQ